jgi:hypothetical protein
MVSCSLAEPVNLPTLLKEVPVPGPYLRSIPDRTHFSHVPRGLIFQTPEEEEIVVVTSRLIISAGAILVRNRRSCLGTGRTFS